MSTRAHVRARTTKFKMGIEHNVTSVSEVSRRGIWAKAIAEARYALLGDVLLYIFISAPLGFL